MFVCSSVSVRRVGFGFISLWHSEQGKIPGVNGGVGTANWLLRGVRGVRLRRDPFLLQVGRRGYAGDNAQNERRHPRNKPVA